ncbi:sulfite reductase, beta subunit (hemoprotein), partial [Frankia sp. QA3]
AGRDRLLAAAAAQVPRAAAASGGSADWPAGDGPGRAGDAVSTVEVDPTGIGVAAGVGIDGGPPGARPGRHHQRDGRWALTALVPLGRLRADQLDLLAAVADADGDGRVMVTPWRSVVLRDLDLPALAGASDRLAAAGLVVDPDSGWVGVTSCAGRPGCARALADVRRDAGRSAEVPGSVRRPGPSAGDTPRRREPLSVHWSGCARRCGQPAGEVVEVVADAAGYRIRGGPGTALLVPWSDGGGPGDLLAAGWGVLVDAVAARRSVARRRCRDGREAR